MKDIGLIKYAALILVVLCSPVKASTIELDRAVGTAMTNRLNPYTKQTRINIAKAASIYWKNFNERIPRNSPEDAEWLKSEMSSGDSNRMELAIKTSHFARRSLVALSSTCATTFELLASGEVNDVQSEMRLWMKTVECYGSSDSIMELLRRLNLADSKYTGTFSRLHHTTYFFYFTNRLADSF